MSRLMIMLLSLLALPAAVAAHDDALEKPALTVTGQGQIMLLPDTAFVTLGIETAGKTVPEVQGQNRFITNKVAERLRGLQIDNERIQTASYSVSPQYKPPPKRMEGSAGPPEIVGYIISTTMTIEVRNLDQVGLVIEESIAAGANQFQALHWALRDEQKAKLAALKQAAAKAREKASALSEALRVKLIRLVHATEESHLVRPVPRIARSMIAMEGGGAETPVYSG
ncbi:MAG TPA: SIMPL domain-containing protein, partial [Nitrospira sp.]|nr:SIMPL domain-containing protein [Nitrospira sp.]